jgi:hypothetical protein
MKTIGRRSGGKSVIEYETPEKSLLDDVRGALEGIAGLVEREHGREDLVAERDALADALRQLEALAPEDLAKAGRTWREIVDVYGSVHDAWGDRARSVVAIELVTAQGRARAKARARRLKKSVARKGPLVRELERYIHALGRQRIEDLGATEDDVDEGLRSLRGSALDLYSRGRCALWEAMAYLGTKEYGDVILALGEAGLPLPRVRDIAPDDPRRLCVGRPIRKSQLNMA